MFHGFLQKSNKTAQNRTPKTILRRGKPAWQISYFVYIWRYYIQSQIPVEAHGIQEQNNSKIQRLRQAITIFCISLVASATYGQSSAPKYSNEFLQIGVDARALAMSKSVVASTADVSAGYWNPAGLASLEYQYEGSLMHASYFAGIANFDYLALATKVDDASYLGLSIIRFAIDDIPDTRFLYDANGALNYDRILFFSAADYAFLLSYARRVPKINNLKFGANFKVVHRKVGDFASAWGFGLDAGLMYSISKWDIGLMARDITGTFNAWSHNTEMVEEIYAQTGNDIPGNNIEITLPRAILGVSRLFLIKEKIGVQPEFDFEFTFDGKRNTLVKSDFASISPRMGTEISYAHLVFARFGVSDFQQVKQFDGSQKMTFQPNFGVGVKIKGFRVDYALTDLGNQAEALYSHVFSLKYGFDPKGE